MRELYENIEHPLVDVLARMEKIGVKIDLEYLDGMATDLDKRIGKLEAECYEFAGERINLGSPKQLRELLYEKLGTQDDATHQERTVHRSARATATRR